MLSPIDQLIIQSTVKNEFVNVKGHYFYFEKLKWLHN